MEEACGFAKTFPDVPGVCQMLGGPSLRLGTIKKCLNILLVSDVVGKTLVDWQRGKFHCELIQHPENP